jgi:hypothetical protein
MHAAILIVAGKPGIYGEMNTKEKPRNTRLFLKK